MGGLSLALKGEPLVRQTALNPDVMILLSWNDPKTFFQLHRSAWQRRTLASQLAAVLSPTQTLTRERHSTDSVPGEAALLCQMTHSDGVCVSVSGR